MAWSWGAPAAVAVGMAQGAWLREERARADADLTDHSVCIEQQERARAVWIERSAS